MLITFEGVEGCGKTTQANLLYETLKQDYKTMITKEPGGTNVGLSIRKILLNPKYKIINKYAELLLYIADRIQHINEILLPNINDNIIICDRYIDSTIVYQSIARGIDINLIMDLHKMLNIDLMPTITFLIDIDVNEGLNRCWNDIKKMNRSMKETRFEQEKIEFHNKIREGYFKLSNMYKDRIKIINGANNIKQVFKDIMDELEKLNIDKYKI